MRTLTLTALLVLIISFPGRAQEPAPIVSSSFYIPNADIRYYDLGDRRIPVKMLQYGTREDLVCINLHDNEGTSVEAAKAILQNTGGTLVKIENAGQRVIRFRYKGVQYAFDPNRIFSETGIRQTLMENCGKSNPEVITEISRFAQYILELIPETNRCIVALHNNTNEAFSIKSYLQGSNREKDAKEVEQHADQDVDDIVLTTDELLFRKMSDLGYNAIWQDNENAKRDGSLSIWSGENQRRYINIETQHGRLGQYVKMLKDLLDYLETEELQAG